MKTKTRYVDLLLTHRESLAMRLVNELTIHKITCKWCHDVTTHSYPLIVIRVNIQQVLMAMQVRDKVLRSFL